MCVFTDTFHEYTRGSQNARFSNRRENIADDDRDGRLKTTERVRSLIEEALNEDIRKTTDELADHLDVSCGTLYTIL